MFPLPTAAACAHLSIIPTRYLLYLAISVRTEEALVGKKPPVSIWVSICSDVICHTSQYSALHDEASIPTPARCPHCELSFSIGCFLLPPSASFSAFPILFCYCALQKSGQIFVHIVTRSLALELGLLKDCAERNEVG